MNGSDEFIITFNPQALGRFGCSEPTDAEGNVSENIDLGNGIYMRYYGWFPDRDIPSNAERYKDIPDVERCGITIFDENGCQGAVTFDTPEARAVFGPNHKYWTVVSWDPLTLTPSILNPKTGFHGFITNGVWVPA